MPGELWRQFGEHSLVEYGALCLLDDGLDPRLQRCDGRVATGRSAPRQIAERLRLRLDEGGHGI